MPIWSEPWFGGVARSVAALVAVLLVLLLGLRPLLKTLRREPPPATSAAVPEEAAPSLLPNSPEMLNRQLGFAQKLVADRPDAAVAALRQMLAHNQNGATA